MSSGPYLFTVLILGIVFVVVATTRWRVHPFLALVVAAYAIGLGSGLSPQQTITALSGGFGRTVGYIGIVIACGCIIGTLLEKSGCAQVLAHAMLRLVGKARAVLAMSCTGAIVSVPVFCDSGFVILSPLTRSLARQTGQSLAGFAVALSMGLYATHCLVPPTPGPLAAAGEIGADIGMVILLGSVVMLPVVAATWLFARVAGQRLYIDPGQATETADAAIVIRHGTAAAFAPILLPVLLIALKSIADLPGRPFGDGSLRALAGALGEPNSALLLGVGMAMLVVRRHGRAAIANWSTLGLREAGVILLITAGGGALGAVLRETAIAKVVSDSLVAVDLGRFSLLLPFLLAAGLKTSIGSSTVALITAASLVAPLLPSMGLAAGLGPALTTLAVASGAMMFSHVNDSFFWIVTQMSGMTVGQGYRLITFASGIAGLTGIATVMLLNLLLT
jgi:GntP family gluconate:H+ symporter